MLGCGEECGGRVRAINDDVGGGNGDKCEAVCMLDVVWVHILDCGPAVCYGLLMHWMVWVHLAFGSLRTTRRALLG